MDIQLSREKIINTSFKCKFLAFIALIISAPMVNRTPGFVEKILVFLTKNKQMATMEEAENARNSICVVSKKCRNQDRCIKRSIASFVMLWLQGRKASWCTGYALAPFRAHAWIEVGGVPVNENDEVKSYERVIKTPDVETVSVTAKKESEKRVDEAEVIDVERKAKLRELFSYVAEKKKLFAAVVICGLISSVFTLMQPELIGGIIEKADGSLLENTSFMILVGVVIGSTLLMTVQYYMLQKISEDAIYKSRCELISHILRMPILNYSKWSSGDLLSRLSGDAAKLRVGIIQITVTLSSSLLLAVGSIIALFIKDFSLSLITVCAMAVTFVLIIVMSVVVQKASYNAQKSMGKLSATVNGSLLGIRTIRSTNETNNEIEKSVREASRLRDFGLKLAKYQAFMTPISNLGLQICGMIVIGIGGYRVSQGQMTIAELTSFVLLMYIAIEPIQQIFSAISSAADSLGSLSRIKEVTELPVENQYDIVSSEKKCVNNKAICFSNVTFSYEKYVLGSTNEEKDEDIVLRDVSFSIDHGECVAIVGPSGAGKSTVLQLIERFYELNSGTIYVNGYDYHIMSREELRSHITYIEQNSPMISGTLLDNLRLGNSGVTENECLEALRMVNLSYLAERDEKGLLTRIDEGGTILSGGEKQRIAMARAILSDSDIILLDELTSNLDSINEKVITEIIDNMRGKKTIIMVAHRLSTTMSADKIYVLEHGRIVGCGTHSELVETVPLYRELAKEQHLV